MALKTVSLTLNGQTYTLVKNANTGAYEKQITAPTLSSYKQSNHVYAMALHAEDMAGNVITVDQNNASLGNKMKLTVKEKVPPIIIITAPGSGAYLTSNTVAISFDVTDNDSGVDPATISLQIDRQAAITSGLTKTAIPGGHRCIYTASIADGTSHTIKVNARDYDGNAAVQATNTFTVDTVPPELNLSSPANNLITNVQSCNVAGTTNDATSAPCTIVVTLNGALQSAVTVNADGSFAKTVSLVKGANTIVVKSTDRAGKYSTVTVTVAYDPDAPIVAAINITPNPVDAGGTFTITVDATD